MSVAPVSGIMFTHDRFLDENRNKAQMRITQVTKLKVFFTYADEPTNKGSFWLDRDVWTERYGKDPVLARPIAGAE
jgi:hypothetical protein